MVLTVSPKKASYRNFDESLSDIVKEIKVTTTNTLEPLKIFSRLTKNSEKREFLLEKLIIVTFS